MVGFLVAALLANTPIATASAAPAPLPQSRPAMWVVRDQDTTIYLFGTFHALDGRTHWFANEVQDAFSSADQLVLETIIPERPGSAARPARPESRPMIRTFTVAPGASFLASTRMAVSAGQDRGLHVSKGADMVLRRAAEATGKPVEGLETVDFQLGMFKRMAPHVAGPNSGAPLHSAEAKARLSVVMGQMQAAWNRGDQRIFAALLDEMRASTPENYRVMFPERNAHWADWIVNRMEQPGTVFVAVGAGHFAGPDSVLSQLTLRGKVATRAN